MLPPDDGVDGLGLAVLLCAELDVLLGHSPLGQVDVPLVPGGEEEEDEEKEKREQAQKKRRRRRRRRKRGRQI